MHPLQDVFQPRGEFLNAKVVLTIHNIAFQVSCPCSYQQGGLVASVLRQQWSGLVCRRLIALLPTAAASATNVAAPQGRFWAKDWEEAGPAGVLPCKVCLPGWLPAGACLA